MQKRCRCHRVISADRSKLGLTTCLTCGATDAQAERELMQKRVAPASNKQGLVYMGPADVAAQNLRDSMKHADMVRGILATTVVTGRMKRESASPPFKELPKARIAFAGTNQQQVTKRRKPIGIIYFGTDPNGQMIFSKDDPRIQRASRVAYFEGGKDGSR